MFCDLIKSVKKEICLDLGAGSCEYSKILLQMEAGHSDCVDFNPSFLSGLVIPGIQKILCDVEYYKTDKKYDLILCLGIIEFLDNPGEFMIRLKTFLKSEGQIIVLLPVSSLAGFIYACIYFLKGIRIHPWTVKKLSGFLYSKGFLEEKKYSTGAFSGFVVYSLKREKLNT